MSQVRIDYFSTLAEQFYNPKNATDREKAQTILETSFPTFSSDSLPMATSVDVPNFNIINPTDTANALRFLLENSPSPFVQVFCLSRLKQLVMAQFSIFDQDTKLQLRTFLLEFAYVHSDLQPFVIPQLASVLALLTRFGWLDVKEYQDVYKDMTQFLQGPTVEHRIIGLQILSVIVQDINAPTLPKYSAKFRKTAAGLRDTQLFDIFENAFQILKGILSRSIPFDKADQETRTKDVTLDLLLKCLSFDFTGTNIDETGEDTGTVQIPTSWKSVFERPDFVPIFFEAYSSFSPPQSGKTMDCLVQIAASRKGLFSSEEARTLFIDRIMSGIRTVIVSSLHMTDSDCYNSFCRLLQRFRTTAPLNEMTEKPGYLEWIDCVATFTKSAFSQPNSSMTSCFYLLGFWSRVVQSMTYYQQLEAVIVQKLQDITMEVTLTFAKANIESVPRKVEEMEDPLDEEEDELIECLSMLGQIARCKYEKSCKGLMEIIEPVIAQYKEVFSGGNMLTMNEESLQEARKIFEAEFTWLVYFMATFIGNRPSYSSSDENDEADGKLVVKFIQIMEISQSDPPFLSESLDSAFIYFFSQLRKSYVGESNVKAFYQQLNDAFGIEGQTDLLNMIMNKVITNLQIWSDSEPIIRRTLELFNELSNGYSSLKNIRKIESTTLLMQNHSSDDFRFLNDDKHKQNRMLYYQVLCKILFSEDNDYEAEFYQFMKPFEMRLDVLHDVRSIEEFRQVHVQRAMLNLFRDLRGFVIPIQSRRNYTLFFDWFYPDHMPVLLRGIEAYSSSTTTPPTVVNTLLKFFTEFVHNKSQRLTLDVSSANGVLLFRDASRIVATYGQAILNNTTLSDESQKYAIKYKGIAACFTLLARCLGGKYINFGVFWLYGDKAVNTAYSYMYKLMLSIPRDDLVNYPKLTKAYFMMVDEFSAQQLEMDPQLPAQAFLYILQACEAGVELTSEITVRAHACSAINNICTFLIQQTEKMSLLDERGKRTKGRRSPDNNNNNGGELNLLLNYLNRFPQVLPKLLTTLFGLVLFGDNNDQWQLSRPLYTLVLLQRDFTLEYTNQVILQQLPERREFVTKALSDLMSGHSWTTNTKDRERFSQQIATLKRELNNNQIVLVVPFI